MLKHTHSMLPKRQSERVTTISATHHTGHTHRHKLVFQPRCCCSTAFHSCALIGTFDSESQVLRHDLTTRKTRALATDEKVSCQLQRGAATTSVETTRTLWSLPPLQRNVGHEGFCRRASFLGFSTMNTLSMCVRH